MKIVLVDFTKPMFFTINHQTVELRAFETTERGNIKLGINAPPQVAVNREEIWVLKNK